MAFTADTNVVADDVAANAVIEPESDDRIYYQTCSEYWDFRSQQVQPICCRMHLDKHIGERAGKL